MMKTVLCVALFATANAHVAFWNHVPNQLQPVQGLYVKPSVDGTTGDLYVAASEDNGVNAQWLTDQPINFLPQAQTLQSAGQGLMPYSSCFSSAADPHDESVVTTQKRAIISQPIKYIYTAASALAGAGSEVASNVNGYSYGVPVAQAAPSTGSVEGSSATPSLTEGITNTYQAQPSYMPMQFLYPSFMSAATSAVNGMKNSGTNEDVSSKVTPYSYPYWPSAGYGYPSMQYVMIDPSAWASTLAAGTATPTDASTTEAAPSENVKQ